MIHARYSASQTAKAFVALALLQVLPLYEADATGGEISAPGLSISFDPGYEADAKRTLAMAPSISREVSSALGIPEPPRVSIDLLGPVAFESATGRGAGEWAVAVAFPAKGRIAIRAAKLDMANDIATTLKHEYVHLLIGLLEARAGALVPAWFHEGVAQSLCARIFYGTRQDFLTAAAAGRLIPFGSIAENWPSEERSARLAYAQSVDFIEFLEKSRAGAVMAILAATEKQRDFHAAFRDVMGESVESSETRWRESAPRGRNLVVALLEDNPGLTWVFLFAAAAVLLVAGYFRYARRKKDLFDSLDD